MKTNLKAFIVHGHDENLRLQLKDYLQNVLKMAEPIILSQIANRGRTIIEKFEEVADQVDVAFVLLTPDDLVSGAKKDAPKYRGRQNVIYELGYFTGRLGRDRTILILKGDIDIPTDLSGILYIKTQNTIEEIGEKIRLEIDAIGDSLQ